MHGFVASAWSNGLLKKRVNPHHSVCDGGVVVTTEWPSDLYHSHQRTSAIIMTNLRRSNGCWPGYGPSLLGKLKCLEKSANRIRCSSGLAPLRWKGGNNPLGANWNSLQNKIPSQRKPLSINITRWGVLSLRYCASTVAFLRLKKLRTGQKKTRTRDMFKCDINYCTQKKVKTMGSAQPCWDLIPCWSLMNP